MKALIWACSFLLLIGLVTDSWARRESLTPEQKSQLEKIQTVLADVLAISDKGAVDPEPLRQVVVARMKEFGYGVTTDSGQPHDVLFRVKCEQHKTWEGTTNMGSDADLPDSPSRVWKGPACQLSYLLNGKKMGWRKEVRTDFSDAEQAAQKDNAGDPAAYAMAKLKERLEDYDFPALITAEWGQEDRLFKLYDDPSTPAARKVKLINLFGYMFSTESVPRLLAALKGPDVEMAKAAALALGNIGQKDTIPVLIETMQSGPPELQAPAAKALGIAGALHGDFSIIEPLLTSLKNDDVAVKTEVAWALGKLPDRRAYDSLFSLQKSLYHVRDNDADPKLVKLKEAVNWSIKQIDTWEYLQ
ncbi:MAG TPA: HEAT repeat domain-containing protein [Nitrospiraceae bacterium]|nr:HEAT repeat domain-containing protein [Nitrospiraceae bacterium]